MGYNKKEKERKKESEHAEKPGELTENTSALYPSTNPVMNPDLYLRGKGGRFLRLDYERYSAKILPANLRKCAIFNK